MNVKKRYKWAVMIYLAGNNSLSEECVYALTEMTKADLGDDIAVVALLNSGVHDNTMIPIRKGMTTEDLHIELNKALSEKAKQRGNQKAPENRDAGINYRDEIFNFVRNCIGKGGLFDAVHYMLILSGHGSGTVGDFIRSEEPSGTKALSVINLGQLLEHINRTLLDSKKLDILGLDSCLMSMTEIAYIVHKHVKVMVGAEGFEPMAGWPYAEVLKRVREQGNDIKALGRGIVHDYVKHYTVYQAANVSVDQSACDLELCVPLMKAIRSLADALIKYLPHQKTANPVVRDAILLSHWEAQLYRNEQYADLYDFCTLLKSKVDKKKHNDVRRACQNVLNAIVGADRQRLVEKKTWDAELADDNFRVTWRNQKAGSDSLKFTASKPRWMAPVNFREAKGFILKSCYSGWTVQYSYGVSIYFPWSEVAADMQAYEQIYFARDSGWADFLKAYLTATKRPPRTGKAARTPFPNEMLRQQFDVAPGAFGSSAHRNADPNKNADPNRSLSNLVGSMKNPPTEFDECDCQDN